MSGSIESRSRLWGMAQTVGTEKSNDDQVVIDTNQDSEAMYNAIGLTQQRLLEKMEEAFGVPTRTNEGLLVFKKK